jgi:hypothetical protein
MTTVKNLSDELIEQLVHSVSTYSSFVKDTLDEFIKAPLTLKEVNRSVEAPEVFEEDQSQESVLFDPNELDL